MTGDVGAVLHVGIAQWGQHLDVMVLPVGYWIESIEEHCLRVQSSVPPYRCDFNYVRWILKRAEK